MYPTLKTLVRACLCAALALAATEAKSAEAATDGHAPITLTHGPWLTYPEVGAVTIGFTTDIASGAGVEYRPQGSTQAYKQRWHTQAGQLLTTQNHHAIRLTDMEPGISYEYRIVLFAPPQSQVGDHSYQKNAALRQKRTQTIKGKDFTFRPFSSDETYRFFVTSDLQFPTERRHQILQNFHNTGMKDARFVVLLGDLYDAVDDMERDILQGIVDKTTALGGSAQPYFFVRGNHEWRGLQSGLWTSYFATPQGSTYTAFSCGDVFYLVLDTGEDKPAFGLTAHYTAANLAEQEFWDAQKAWLTGVVDSPEFKAAKFRIVLAHSAPYSHGGRYMSKRINDLVEDLLAGTTADKRVHLWISGHTHFYARTVPGTLQAYTLSRPVKKFYRDDRYAFPVVTLDGPGGEVDISGLQVSVEKDRLLLEMLYENGTVFDRCEIRPDGSITNLNEGLHAQLNTFEQL